MLLIKQQQNVHVNMNLLHKNKLMFASIVVFHHHVKYFELLGQMFVEYLSPKQEHFFIRNTHKLFTLFLCPNAPVPV